MGEDFGSTHWSIVLQAARADSVHARAALDALCKVYWYPLYVYVRRRGATADDASDLTQEFFTRQVATGAIFHGVDPGRGRFRAWLLAAFKHFVSNARDRERAKKRGGDEQIVSLDADDRYLHEAVPAEADRLYERSWANTVIALARERVRTRRDAGPLLDELLKHLPGGERGPIAEAASRLGMTEGALKTAVSRFRDDFADAIRFEISRTVSTAAEVEEEIRALLAAAGE